MRHDNSCRFRLYPNKQQRELIAKTFGCCRWVYNWGLAIRKKARGGGEEVSFFNWYSVSTSCYEKRCCNILVKRSRCKGLDIFTPLYDTAYQNFFKHQSGFPRFKAKSMTGINLIKLIRTFFIRKKKSKKNMGIS